MSRRDALLRAGAVLAGAGAALGPQTALAARRRSVGVVYRLRATGHCSCRACHRHAANKLFATRAAAHHGRAHRGCRCEVVRASIGPEAWRKLFGSPAELHRTSVDRRRRSTRRVLGRARRRATARRKHRATRGLAR
jgi:hypothetical protein